MYADPIKYFNSEPNNLYIQKNEHKKKKIFLKITKTL
jgi:hypothetical protein